ncbi:MAG: M48 family metalloprotease [Candidatus Scalinduaceae bacterium]
MSEQKAKAIIIRIAIPLMLVIFLFACGCANTGPRISKEELKKLEEEIEALATERFIKDWVRTWKVGFNVLSVLPEDTLKKHSVIGALIVDNSEDIAKSFGLPTEDGCVVIGVVENYMADLAGLKPGDLIIEIGGKEIKDDEQIVFENGKSTIIIVERDGDRLSFEVKPKEMPYVRVRLKQTGKINAYAKFTGIQFTSGMVHFVEDDDELAVIMGHEIAHLVSKHLPKNISMAALCGLVGGLTGPFAPLTTQALYAPYSRENEREADYIGLYYAHIAGYNMESGVALWKRFALEIPKSRSKSFLRSHPASPERILRVKKVVELIKSDKNPLGEKDR